MRTLCFVLTVSLLSILTAMPEPTAAQPYSESDACRVYSLLLPHEESYGFAKSTLIIQEETVANAAVVGACLSPEVAKRFKPAGHGDTPDNPGFVQDVRSFLQDWGKPLGFRFAATKPTVSPAAVIRAFIASM